jgi:hypothetical protein
MEPIWLWYITNIYYNIKMFLTKKRKIFWTKEEKRNKFLIDYKGEIEND